MSDIIRAKAIRYEIVFDTWHERESKTFEGNDAAERAEAWCEAFLTEGESMAWAETQIGMQGSVEDLDYDDWQSVWEIVGLDAEGNVEELQYGD